MRMQRLIIRIVFMAVAVGVVAFYQHRKDEEERQKLNDEMNKIAPQVLPSLTAAPTPLPSAFGPVPSGTTPLVATPPPATPAPAPAQ